MPSRSKSFKGWQRGLSKRSKLPFSREELNRVLDSPDYNPKALISLFEKALNKEFDADSGVREKYSIKTHTLMVMRQFEKYFSKNELPAGLPVCNFLELLLIYYQVDAGSYTEDAGGIKSLDHLFVFNRAKGWMYFSAIVAVKVDQLKIYTEALPNVLWLDDRDWHVLI